MERFKIAIAFLFVVTLLVLGALVLTDGQGQEIAPTFQVVPTPPTQAATQTSIVPTPMIIPTPNLEKGVVLSPSPK